ncbi:MAG: ABC transporter permease [Oligoflexales bacterium]|nr:ABC transporter permease [Oligoflexales bacterium]
MASLSYLTFKSILNRRQTAFLTLFTIAVSVTLLLSIQRVRDGAKFSFENTISGADLIVGARTGSIELLLFSIFRLGYPTQNVSAASYTKIRSWPGVDWSIPLAIGDSHQGYKVIGTDDNLFKHYKFGRTRPLEFLSGQAFSDASEAVIGFDVAKEQNYSLNKNIIVRHGESEVHIVDHEDVPIKIVGIIAKTGTPIDRSIFVSLDAIAVMHHSESDKSTQDSEHEHEHEHEHEQKEKLPALSAFILGLDSRLASIGLQRQINDYPDEALLAILPGASFAQLWGLISGIELALLVISFFVFIAGLLGMLSSLLSTLNERRREMAILRAIGAKPRHIFWLLVSESVILTTAGALLGFSLLFITLAILKPWLEHSFGVFLPTEWLTREDVFIIAGVLAAGLFAGLIPAYQAYKNSLSDGLSIRI